MYKYIVNLKHYIPGQGYSHEEVIDSGITESIFPASSWNAEGTPLSIGEVMRYYYEVVVSFYTADADPMFDDPISTDSCWIDC